MEKMRDLLMFVDLPKFTGCRFLDLIQFLGKSSFLRLPRLPLPLFSRLTLAICLISIIFSIFIPLAWSAQVTLEWQASSGDVAGYNVYQGTSSRDYDVTLQKVRSTTSQLLHTISRTMRADTQTKCALTVLARTLPIVAGEVAVAAALSTQQPMGP